MKAVGRPILKIVGIIVVLGVAVAIGYVAAASVWRSDVVMTATQQAAVSSTKDMTYGTEAVGSSGDANERNLALNPSAVAVAPEAAQTAAPERMVVSSASMDIRVTDADKSLATIRAIAAASNSEIANLSVTSGELSPQPVPLASGSSGTSVSGPVSAQVTLRVPADKLALVERQVAKVGTVISQSVAEDDVTQQHVDMVARLKNLQAEEARLRTFLTRTAKVSELLEVERELARVRGEIESMQAQLTYLERQAAMATLSISLSEPGPVVSPGAGGWGLSQAVTDGVRSAAALVRASITVLIALAPVLIVIGVLVLVFRLLRHRRAGRAEERTSEAEADDAGEAPAEQA